MDMTRSSRWRRESKAFLRMHPCCMCPTHKGLPDAPLATDVDHITPHGGNAVLFWDRRNWQALAERCHQSWKYQVERYAQKRSVYVQGPRTWLPPNHIPARSSADVYSPAPPKKAS